MDYVPVILVQRTVSCLVMKANHLYQKPISSSLFKGRLGGINPTQLFFYVDPYLLLNGKRVKPFICDLIHSKCFGSFGQFVRQAP